MNEQLEGVSNLQGSKVISFRPFRRVGDKLVVTSYMGWNRIYTANYSPCTVKLLPFPEIKGDETVYAFAGKLNHWRPVKFEACFWPVHARRIRHHDYTQPRNLLDDYPIQDDEVYSVFDSHNCPTFSHHTSVYVEEHYPDKMHLWEPLIADIIYRYFEIMRDQLTNITWINSQSK